MQTVSLSLRGSVGAHRELGEPLRACAALWRARTGVDIAWTEPAVDAAADAAGLAGGHDLLIVEPARIGACAGAACLLPLNRPDRTRDLVRLAGQSVGASFVSYRMSGDQWALPVTATAQVQVWRADRLAGPVGTWDDLLRLARHGRVLLPMRPPQCLLLFLTLTANLGQPCGMMGEAELNDATFGAGVLERIRALMDHVDSACLRMDAASVCERVSEVDAAEHCVPFVEGIVGYARPGWRPAPLAFAAIPVAGQQGPVGATLGGAGIAVSARSPQVEAALAFAYWVASGEVQRGPFADAGGQPANALAWNDAAVDAANGGFYSAARETMENAVMRPRHDGWLAFQHAAAERIIMGLAGRESGKVVMADLNRMYARSFG
jgi:multiple sugar transport system substrate-binding protein